MNKVHTFLDEHTSVGIRAFLFFMSRGRVSVVVLSQKSGSSTSTLETIMMSVISTLADHNGDTLANVSALEAWGRDKWRKQGNIANCSRKSQDTAFG